MKLHKLPAIVDRSKKRVGRGHGSGKVKTAGRGTKGQKARGSVRPGFEGGQLSLIKRLPFLRGKMRNRSQKAKAFAVPIFKLHALPDGTTVTLEVLQEYHIISKGISMVKILGGGSLSNKLNVTLSCSKSAKRAIEKAGGKVSLA